jgi:hypothetical protein
MNKNGCINRREAKRVIESRIEYLYKRKHRLKTQEKPYGYEACEITSLRYALALIEQDLDSNQFSMQANELPRVQLEEIV